MRRIVLVLSLLLVLAGFAGPLNPAFVRAWECRCDSCCAVLDSFPITTAAAVYFEGR